MALPQALPCPFCGKFPKITPTNPKLDGNAWAAVQCVNSKCAAKPRVEDGAKICDERGSDAYKALAVRRWNRRHTVSFLLAALTLLPLTAHAQSCPWAQDAAGTAWHQVCREEPPQKAAEPVKPVSAPGVAGVVAQGSAAPSVEGFLAALKADTPMGRELRWRAWMDSLIFAEGASFGGLFAVFLAAFFWPTRRPVIQVQQQPRGARGRFVSTKGMG